MNFFDPFNHNLAYSQIKFNGNDLSKSNVGTLHSLPHITQPILTKYRTQRISDVRIIE